MPNIHLIHILHNNGLHNKLRRLAHAEHPSTWLITLKETKNIQIITVK